MKDNSLAFYSAIHQAQMEGRLMPLSGDDDQPTKYKGIEFATRLQAAWARYFDEIEVEWRYEASGDPADFQLPDLRGLNLYADIEAEGEQRFDRALIQNILNIEGSTLAIIYGYPSTARMDLFFYDGHVERDMTATDIFHNAGLLE